MFTNTIKILKYTLKKKKSLDSVKNLISMKQLP